MYQIRFILLGLFLLLLAVGCTATPTPAANSPVTLRLMTHDSFDISEATLAAFTEQTGHTVEIVRGGDAGELVNKSVLAREAPLADVIFGVDNTFLSRALENDILLPYESPLLANIPDALELDSAHRALPVDFGDVCLNYDKTRLAELGIEPPQTLGDLTKPEYRDLLVVQNPATSSAGLSFLLATIAYFGEDGYLDFWRQLRANGVLVTTGWSEGYYGHFSAAAEEGTRPLIVSYASSPPAEIYYAETALVEPPTAAITAPGTCFRQIEFVGILTGTPHELAARQLVDFMLSSTFQEDMPLHMFVYPANEQATLPAIFTAFGAPAQEPVTVPFEEIALNRERWVNDWSEVMLR
jgi:thiamine transport system substrate-binding protein